MRVITANTIGAHTTSVAETRYLLASLSGSINASPDLTGEVFKSPEYNLDILRAWKAVDDVGGYYYTDFPDRVGAIMFKLGVAAQQAKTYANAA